MAKKENNRTPMPNDSGHDFSEDNDILNFRPNIQFVSPAHQPAPPGDVSSVDEIGDARQETQDLIDGFDAAGQLVEIAQQRIDARVDSLGGLDINLDPKVDAVTISAMKRFGCNLADPTKITYECYQKALKTISGSANPPPLYGPLDIRQAQETPYKTDFGGLGALPGLNRPEISSPANAIAPLDLVAFQIAAVAALFIMLIKLITGLIKKVMGVP